MSVRSYPVPRSVGQSIGRAAPRDSLSAAAISAAVTGRVSGYHLPLLASSGWSPGAKWAESVLERERTSAAKRADTLLAAAGFAPDEYAYYGVLDPGYPDHELIMSVARSPYGQQDLERWDGMDWGTAEIGPDGLEYVLLDREVLADVLDAIDTGSAGVVLRPFDPKAWVRDGRVMDSPVLAAAAPPKHTGAMVALYPAPEVAADLAIEGGEPPEDMHCTLVYLGDTTEEPIDYGAVQRGVTKWARRMNPMEGEISGSGLFTGGEEGPVTVALVDIPTLPEAREMLVRILTSEGVKVKENHGFTPHVTLAYDDVDVNPENYPLEFNDVVVKYADDIQRYDLGSPIVAAVSNPDTVYAVVDEFDSSAVLDLVRVIQGPVAYRRSGGKWIKDNSMLRRLMGVDPPPVVAVPAEQTQSVIDQVDAYDRENPEEPVTAAGVWSDEQEKLHPRDGGKFAKKQGGSSAPKANASLGKTPPKTGKGVGSPIPRDGDRGNNRPKHPGRRDRDLTDRDVGLGRRTQAQRDRIQARRERRRRGNLKDNPAAMRRAMNQMTPKFWAAQPPGFKEWLANFTKPDSPDKSSSGASSSNDDDRDDRTKAQKKADRKQQAENDGKNARDSANDSGWWSQVPPRYRAAMRAFLSAASANAGKGDAGMGKGPVPQPSADRVSKLDKADRTFDLEFAKAGLDESRRRTGFDTEIVELQKRLARSGANPDAIASLMRQKVMQEKQRREAFERKRKLEAEQERVRRMAARDSELDKRDREEAVTADASMMPTKLKKYWLGAEGAAKIRWGTSGDFDRCVRALGKYLNPGQVKGACANLHKLATGQWPGKGREH